jgi:hypothetical protein
MQADVCAHASYTLGGDRVLASDLHHFTETHMSDDKSKSGGQDRKRINVHEDYELRDWSKSLNVTPEQLKKAVASVGDSADAVREHLKKSK